jgi:hypothetical protein
MVNRAKFPCHQGKPDAAFQAFDMACLAGMTSGTIRKFDRDRRALLDAVAGWIQILIQRRREGQCQ